MSGQDNEGIFLYDFLLVKGGAESLGITLVKGLQKYDFCVAFSDASIFSEVERKQLNLIELTHFTAIMGWQSIKSIFAFRYKSNFIKDYKQVIYSGIYSPVAVKNHPKGQNILYCHTPPRFVYDLKDYYLQQVIWWKRPLLKMLSVYVKYHYEQALTQMDIIIANSENVRGRIKYYLGKDSIVIYPPIAVAQFNWIEQGDYYLSLSRLEPYKRVELIVRSFLAMPDKKLIVASGGSDLERLKNLAKNYTNIEFTGWCDTQQLQELIGRCIATIYIPPDEDFGMSPVESMAAGKPVIGVAEGGLLETIIHEETGLLISTEISKELLINAVSRMTKKKALTMRKACEARAQLFRTEVFVKKMKAVLG
ncbi:MAG: glycosyltransferase [gamma proteobacterium symbiont of Taylorina sp.]|nr:glycosyltransferase [gamma proteobacterium symbiont of Taylorina sp.]